MTTRAFTSATPARRPPRGYSLIEMLVVITLISFLLGLCSVTLQRILRVERGGRAALEESTTVDRLAEQFRRDAHAALSARVEPDKDTDTPMSLVFAPPEGGPVEYRARENTLIVNRRTGQDQDQEPDGPAEEVFRFARWRTPRLAVIEEDGRSLAVLSFEPAENGDGGTPARDLRIEATVGRAHRFEARGDQP